MCALALWAISLFCPTVLLKAFFVQKREDDIFLLRKIEESAEVANFGQSFSDCSRSFRVLKIIKFDKIAKFSFSPDHPVEWKQKYGVKALVTINILTHKIAI